MCGFSPGTSYSSHILITCDFRLETLKFPYVGLREKVMCALPWIYTSCYCSGTYRQRKLCTLKVTSMHNITAEPDRWSHKAQISRIVSETEFRWQSCLVVSMCSLNGYQLCWCHAAVIVQLSKLCVNLGLCALISTTLLATKWVWQRMDELDVYCSVCLHISTEMEWQQPASMFFLYVDWLNK